MRFVLAGLAALSVGGAVVAVLQMPSDADHAAATPRDVILAMSDPSGAGPLDGLRFDTDMGLQGKPADVVDDLRFQDGLFMSRDREDRCNYPPSAYLARAIEGRTDFIVEAYCPTKSTTMVWRGSVRCDDVSGTVTWASQRWYWDTTQVLALNGHLSDQPAKELASR